MAIAAGSRYQAGTVQRIMDASGVYRPTILMPDRGERRFNYTGYMVRDDDRIDLLAYQFYGDSTMWWFIAEANPEIMNWSNLTAGTVLRIPSADANLV